MLWCRFLTFCVVVICILFVVVSCIHGRPVTHLFFHRCCGDDIENDQVIFENLEDNFLRERLIANRTLLNELVEEIVFVEDNEISEDGRMEDSSGSALNELGDEAAILLQEDNKFNDKKSSGTHTELHLETAGENIEVQEMMKRLREVVIQNPKFRKTIDDKTEFIFNKDSINKENSEESDQNSFSIMQNKILNNLKTEGVEIKSGLLTENSVVNEVLNNRDTPEILVVKNPKYRKNISLIDVTVS